MDLTPACAAMRDILAALPGAAPEPASAPGALIFKVMGKMFAILSYGKVQAVSLKCDPHLAEILREQYAGVGHRYHLDRRHWISVSLDADVLRIEFECHPVIGINFIPVVIHAVPYTGSITL